MCYKQKKKHVQIVEFEDYSGGTDRKLKFCYF